MMSDSAVQLAEPSAQKEEALRALLRSWGQVLVAFSGGVDSTYLAKIAHQELGDSAVALTAESASLLPSELADAVALAQEIGIRHEVVQTNELGRPGYVQNASDRCYYCKTELFDAALLTTAKAESAVVVDGFNCDDLQDHRPGHRAAAEHGVCHPLAEVGLTKEEIRSLSKRIGLRTWAKPQLACLASRLPYGMKVTEARLIQVGALETALREQDFFDVRARLVKDNDDMVRIEVGDQELTRILQPDVRAAIISAAHRCGFRFVTLDLEGFRSGRMNDGLSPSSLIRIGSS